MCVQRVAALAMVCENLTAIRMLYSCGCVDRLAVCSARTGLCLSNAVFTGEACRRLALKNDSHPYGNDDQLA